VVSPRGDGGVRPRRIGAKEGCAVGFEGKPGKVRLHRLPSKAAGRPRPTARSDRPRSSQTDRPSVEIRRILSDTDPANPAP